VDGAAEEGLEGSCGVAGPVYRVMVGNIQGKAETGLIEVNEKAEEMVKSFKLEI